MQSGRALMAALLAGASGSKLGSKSAQPRRNASYTLGRDVLLLPSSMPNRSALLYTEMAKTGSGTLRRILPFVQADCMVSVVVQRRQTSDAARELPALLYGREDLLVGAIRAKEVAARIGHDVRPMAGRPGDTRSGHRPAREVPI